MSGIRHEPVARTVKLELTGGSTIDRHHHDGHQLVYVSAGVVQVTTEDGTWVASRDRAVWLPAGTWHEHRFYGPSRFHTVGFATDDSPWRQPTATIVTVSALLRELLVACSDPGYSAAELRRLRAVISDQLRRSPQQPITFPAPRDPRLVEACALASEQLDRTVPLADLAARCGASARTLSRLFRDELGMTYPQWRTRTRLLHATVLLSGGASVTQTALDCGWHTTSSFVDTFHRAMGQTPGSYRTTATA